MQLLVQEFQPATGDQYTGSAFSQTTGIPQVDPADRSDYLDQVPGSDQYEHRPGVPNWLDLQSDGIQATNGVSGDDNGAMGYPALAPDPAFGYSPIPQYVDTWWDSLRPNAGYPLPVPNDFGGASQFESANDDAAVYANADFGIEPYERFEQPDLNPTNSRMTERSFDIPADYKANPTFPVTIQHSRPWDRVMGAWPWSGTKTGIPQGIQPPNYYPDRLTDGVVSPGGAVNATVPNTPSLWPQPMTWRVLPEQWDDNYIVSGL